VRSAVVFSFLALIRALAKVFYRVEMRWIGTVSPDPWRGPRLVVFLNHTSLYEPVFAGCAPHRFFWRLARHGVVAVAQKTTSRPVVGWIFKSIAGHVVALTRQRDHTWIQMLRAIDSDSMVVIAPEGRMKRANGLDANGQPLRVRGGVADILEAVPAGTMLIAYSGGLHHVQIPGQRWPRIFRRVGILLEELRIEEYVAARQAEGSDFVAAVKADLEARRDRHCPEAARMSGVPYVATPAPPSPAIPAL
jgi:hypothetical protein